MSPAVMMLISLGILFIAAGGSLAVYRQSERWRRELEAEKRRSADLERLCRAPRLELLPLEEFDLDVEPLSAARGSEQS